MPPSSAACPHDGLLRSGTALFERRCGPFRAPGTPGVFAFGLRLVAWDGTALDVPDTLANAAEFGDTGKNGNPHAPHAARSCARSWSISCRRAVSGNAAASRSRPSNIHYTLRVTWHPLRPRETPLQARGTYLHLSFSSSRGGPRRPRGPSVLKGNTGRKTVQRRVGCEQKGPGGTGRGGTGCDFPCKRGHAPGAGQR